MEKYIVVDIATSDFLVSGQILRYEFRTYVAGENVDYMHGEVILANHQIPSVDAIEQYGINIDCHLPEHIGSRYNLVTEQTAANEIFDYLDNSVRHGIHYLIGSNLLSYQIHHIRNLLIRYGLNPYFSRLNLVDLREMAKYFETIQNANIFESYETQDILIGLLSLVDKGREFDDLYLNPPIDQIDECITLFDKLNQKFNAPLNNLSEIKPGQMVFRKEMVDSGCISIPYIMIDRKPHKAYLMVRCESVGPDNKYPIEYITDKNMSFVIDESMESDPKLHEHVLRHVIEHQPTEISLDTRYEDSPISVDVHPYKLPFHEITILRKWIANPTNLSLLDDTTPHLRRLVLQLAIQDEKYKAKRIEFMRDKYVHQNVVVDHYGTKHWTLKEQMDKLDSYEFTPPWIRTLKAYYQTKAEELDVQ
jgi:hypothetical protein